ncbi:MAG: hypothetical protein R3246_07375, partial [Acidimicrobiia bacterium]|nr:hypothetical protein [Acidimicrobiia bacterium]
MIRVFHHDGQHFRSVPYAGDVTIPDAGWVWVDVVGADYETISGVGADFGFDPLSIDDVVT